MCGSITAPPVSGGYLIHYGISGQRWGIRRFQKQDGSLTPEGRERYLGGESPVKYRKDSNGIEYSDVKDRKGADWLYANSAVTKEGIHLQSDDDRKMLKDVLEQRFGIDTGNMKIHTIDGKTMNKLYKLTGDNAYQNNFHLLCITGLPFGTNLDSFKQSMGCRWFDDVVDNNAERER